ncbi:MAG: nucleotidyltransferase family protein [Coprothermobacterota bacterium]|nr:nucleotidyltransferase family protein [Coprothermobacterota bacterium]
MKIVALILAAGKSERMGVPKMLLSWGKRTILEQVVSCALEGGVQEAVVVIGDKAELIEKKLKENLWPKPVRTVFNPDYSLGMLSSIQCGLKALNASCDATLLALGDQPTIPAIIYQNLVELFPRCGKGILIPRFQGKRGHPIIIQKKYFDFILALDPLHESMHQLTGSFPEDIFDLEVESPEILRDIDRPEDLKELAGKENCSGEGF